MTTSYSIAEARHNLAAIVHELEQTPIISLTRRGEPVAVLIAQHEFQRMQAGMTNFWDAYAAFRQAHDIQALEIEPEVFAGVRDRSPGREVTW